MPSDALQTLGANPAEPRHASRRAARRTAIARSVLALLIFSPLVYSDDGDPLRYLQVGVVALVFLLVAVPNLASSALWTRAGASSVLALALVVLVQPAFVAGAGTIFNIKYAVYLALCFMPLVCSASCRPGGGTRDSAFVASLLRLLFILCAASLLVSAATGLGEVYSYGGGPLQRRSFAWMGDSFSPVMVFFVFYFLLSRRYLSAAAAVICVVQIMQAKTAIGMMVLGLLVYLGVTGRRGGRLLVVIAALAALLVLPALPGLLSDNLHNFDHSLNNRLLSFNAGIEFFLASPWLGIGANMTTSLLEASFIEYREVLIENEIPFYEFTVIHNAFLRMLAEVGLVGLAVMLVFCVTMLRRSGRALRVAFAAPHGEQRALVSACALWLISFVLFYQTTGWFEPGHPQLAWLLCFYGLMNHLRHAPVSHPCGAMPADR